MRTQRPRVALANLTQRLTTAREERDRREAAYRALDALMMTSPYWKWSSVPHMHARWLRAWRKLSGARRVVQTLEDRINARLGALGNYCVGDPTDAEEHDR